MTPCHFLCDTACRSFQKDDYGSKIGNLLNLFQLHGSFFFSLLEYTLVQITAH